MKDTTIEKESLKEEMTSIVEEARMVIPGVQALFGFQTMAVFNNRFAELPLEGKFAYLGALGLLTLSIGLLMTPAAYHRLAERGQVSRRMIEFSSRAITAGMIPLMLAFAVDVCIVILAVLDNVMVGVVGGTIALVLLGALWFGLPLLQKWRIKP